jgi:hypothetical protein
MKLAMSIPSAALCSRCSQPLPVNSPICPTCDQAPAMEKSESDDAYNQTIKWWVRVSCLVSGMITYVAIRATGRRPSGADFFEMVLIPLLAGAALWGLLRLKYPRSRRNLWRTALIPGYLLVAVVFVFHAAGSKAGPAEAIAAPPVIAVAVPPPQSMVPLIRLASECFTDLESQAKKAGNEAFTANLPAMFTLKPESVVHVRASRAKLKVIDAQLLEVDGDIRDSASSLGSKVEAADAPEAIKSTVMKAVRESGTELVRRCREAVAHQRRLVQQADIILAFIEPRIKRLAAKPKQTVFANRADQAAFEKLVKQYDAFEEQSTLLLRRLHSKGDESKQQLLVALTQRQAW